MSRLALPVLFAIFVWWFSTGIVLYLVRIGGSKIYLMIGGATAALAASSWGLVVSSQWPTVGGAYVAFTCAILIWGWVEITFLSGLITGPRTAPCPAGCTGWRRVGCAINAILYHELVLVALAAMIVAVTWNGSNQAAAMTFLVLWTMRLSAKLNLFLGVPILNDEFLPERLGYLRSFFARGPLNRLFPVAVTISTVVTAWWVVHAVSAASAFETTEFLLFATLLGLAVLEHWFMVVPLPVTALWAWNVGTSRFGKSVPEVPTDRVAVSRAFGAPRRGADLPYDDVQDELAADAFDMPPRRPPADRNRASGCDYPAPAVPVAACTGVLPHPLLATIWRHP